MRFGILCLVALMSGGCGWLPREYSDPQIAILLERRASKDGPYDVVCDVVAPGRRRVRLSGVRECSGKDVALSLVAFVARNNALPYARGRNYEVVVVSYPATREVARWPIEPPEVRPPGAPDEDLHVARLDSLAISADGEVIAISYQKSSSDSALWPMITLWETRSGKLLGVLPLPPLSAEAKRILEKYPGLHIRYVADLDFSSHRRYLTAYIHWAPARESEAAPERPEPSVFTYDLKLSGLAPPAASARGA